MAVPPQPARLAQEFSRFRNDMITQLQRDFKTLRSAITLDIRTQAPTGPSQFQALKSAKTRNKTSVPLDAIISNRLDHFASTWIQRLEEGFNKRFSLLPTSVESQIESDPGVSPAPVARLPSTLPDSAVIATVHPLVAQDSQSSDQDAVEAVSEKPSQLIPTSNDSTATSPLSELDDADIESSLPESSLPSDIRSEIEVNRTPSSRLQRSGSLRQSKRKPKSTVVIDSKKQKQFPSLTDLAAQLTSANSIRRFITHVSIWRTSSVTLPDFRSSGNWAERAAKHYILGDDLDNSSKLYKFLSLLARIQVARSIDQRAADLGYERVPADMIEEVLEKLGKRADAATRKKLQDQLKFPRSLERVLGEYRDLMSFLPLDDDGPVTMKDYLQMPGDTTTAFHAALENDRTTTILAKVGCSFEKSITGNVEFPKMIWESIDAEELGTLTKKRLVRLLDVQYIHENIFGRPSWDKPDGWPGAWPVDPDGILDGEQCVVCHGDACQCIGSCFARPPCVASYGRKGLGLRAASPAKGELAYKKNQRIGQIVGRIVAPCTYEDGFALDLVRSDMAGEPTVGQIYTRTESNVFRFVNHRCRQPSVRVCGEAISGRYRMIIYASRDIDDGEELTADWGTDFLNGIQCLCEDCQEH
ncbi:SET domain-containing protein [Apiospora phragmitis]|uniref:SET domain-containing protein n=1 Tax=Apiospora phragmitis TaxID=2905665 RepID=A0ABR1TNS4_9PEZI